MQESKAWFNNRSFFLPPRTHPNPPISATAKRIAGSKEAEALGHKEHFSYCEKQAPEHLPPKQTKDGIYRRRMTSPKLTGDSPHTHLPSLHVLRVLKHSTFAFSSTAAAN